MTAILSGDTAVVILCLVRCQAFEACVLDTTSLLVLPTSPESGKVLSRQEARVEWMHLRCDLDTSGRHQMRPSPGDLEARQVVALSS